MGPSAPIAIGTVTSSSRCDCNAALARLRHIALLEADSAGHGMWSPPSKAHIASAARSTAGWMFSGGSTNSRAGSCRLAFMMSPLLEDEPPVKLPHPPGSGTPATLHCRAHHG